MSTARNRIVSLALAVCLLLGMTLVVPGPVTVSAADVKIQQGPPDVTVNSTVIGFAGHEWWVIGDYTSGVVESDDEDYIILLSKNYNFSDSKFSDYDHIYKDSSLHDAMIAVYDGFGTAEPREQDLVIARDVGGVSGSPMDSGDEILSGQDVWPLSVAEWQAVYGYPTSGAGQEVLSYGKNWWLRSPDVSDPSGSIALVGAASGSLCSSVPVNNPLALRPAFQLNLESVIFTSDAAGGKSVTAGDPLSPAQPVAQNLKLTVKDPTMSLAGVNTTTLTKAQGEAFDIAYSSASHTGGDHYVSCVLVKDNEVKYYGKLEAANSGGGNATVKLPADIPTGSYTLRMFVEEANGNLYTDFASDPVDIPLSVTRALNTDAGLATVAGQMISLIGGHAGDLGDPHTAAIHLPNGVGQVDVSGIVPTDANATVNLYSDALFSQGMDQPIPLAEGVATDLYIKVTAEDPAIVLYYKVTATRALLGQHVVTITADPAAGGRPTASPNPATTTQLVKLEANPADGYAFDRWESASPGVAIASPTQLSTTFVMPDNDVAVVARYTANDPDPVDPVDPGSGGAPIVSGAGGGRSGGSSDSGQSAAPVERRTEEVEDLGGYRFRVDLPLLGFYDAYVDGTKLTRGEDYTVTEGSTVLALRESYIAALSPGTHTLQMEFIAADGYIDFVAGAVTGTDSDLPLGMYDDHYVDTVNPNTGDGRGTWLAALLGAVSAAVLVVCRKKRVRG